MKVRRVVTGHTPEGKSTFVSDEELDPITLELFPGFEQFRLWGADEPPTLPDDGSPPAQPTYFPPVGGFRFLIVTTPPGDVVVPEDIDFPSALAKVEEQLPGLAEHMEPESPGMHTTDTVDFEVILSGEIWLELDDGAEMHLKPGDTVIQNGTRHAWRNKGTEPCTFAVAIVGAHRKP